MSRGWETLLSMRGAVWSGLRAVSVAGLLSAGIPRTAWAAEPATVEQSAEQRVVEAYAAQKEGRLDEATRLFAEAFRLVQSSEYRNTDFALEVVLAVADAHRQAFAASSDDYAICERSRVLLLEFASGLEAEGRPIPAQVIHELDWLDDQLAEAPAPVPPVIDAPPVEDEPDAAIEIEPFVGPPDDEQLPEIDTNPPTEPHGPDAIGIALVATGAVVSVAGAVLLGVGAPLTGRAEQYRDDAVASPEFEMRRPDDQEVASGYFDAYVADERRRGTILMATGGAALGLGIAAAVVGAIRLARHRGPAAGDVAIVPTLRSTRATLGLSFEF